MIGSQAQGTGLSDENIEGVQNRGVHAASYGTTFTDDPTTYCSTKLCWTHSRLQNDATSTRRKTGILRTTHPQGELDSQVSISALRIEPSSVSDAEVWTSVPGAEMAGLCGRSEVFVVVVSLCKVSF